MLHHAIGLFLEVVVNQLTLDDFEAPSSKKLGDREPRIFYWWDLGMGRTTASQKRVFWGLEAFGDIDSGQEDTSESDKAEFVEKEESTLMNVGSDVASSGSTFFTPPQLSTLVHLTTSMLVIPLFG